MGENIPSNRNESVVCVGASLVDLTFRCDATPVLNTSNPATMHRSPGGVVRNIAHHLSLLNIPVELITVLGDDPDGHWLSKQCTDIGISMKGTVWLDKPTGTFASIATPAGDLHIGAVSSETDVMLNTDFLQSRSEIILNASVVVADCNLSVNALKWLIKFCNENDVPLIIETVSVPKAPAHAWIQKCMAESWC